MINNKIYKLVVLTSLSFIISQNAYCGENFANITTNHEVIAKYENGGKGYEAVKKDTYGGYSYGKWQISTKRNKNKSSTFELFLSYLKKNSSTLYTQLTSAGGYTNAFNGENNFKNKWKTLCKDKQFQEIYDNFILDTQIYPAYKALQKDNTEEANKIIEWALTDDKVQAGVNSAIIQHGPNGCHRLINRVIAYNKLTTKEKFLKDLYTARKNKFSKYKKRYADEYHDLTHDVL